MSGLRDESGPLDPSAGSTVDSAHGSADSAHGSADSAHGSALDLLGQHLHAVSRRAHERLGDIAGVAVTFREPSGPLTAAASSDLARRVDETQFAIGQGPCLHALHTGEHLYVPDLAHDTRWGEYGAKAAALGAASCLSHPVGGSPDTAPMAVLKVYASRVDGISDQQRRLTATFAAEVTDWFALAGRLVGQASALDDRAAAMRQRRVIDLALGIVMERSGVGAAQAFELLRSRSQSRRVRLAEVAEELVMSIPGAIPDDLTAPFRQR